MAEAGEERKTSGWLKVGCAAYYCGASMAVQFVNKSLFTTYAFHFPLTVTLLQLLVIAPVCYAVAKPKLEWELARAIFPLSAVNVLNVISGLMGTGGLNVPMFIALRRFTLLCTIVLERFMLKKSHDNATIGAVTVMIGGALVAAATDLSFNLYGYSAVISNDFLTALYLIMGLSTTGLLFYNAVLSIPGLALALLLSREPWGVLAYPRMHHPGFQAVLVMSCALGLTINHSTFVCTRYNDPLTTSVAGNLKNILMTAVGAWAFGDYLYQRWNVLGLALSMGGAVWYATKAALRARKKSREQQRLLLPTRDPSKLPLIGRDRLALLKANEVQRNGSIPLSKTRSIPGSATGAALAAVAAGHKRSDSH